MDESGDFVLGVDLDGVCADYTAALRTAVARARGIDPAELTSKPSWDFVEWDLDRDAFLAEHRRAVVEEHMFLSLDPLEGVADALWRLSDAGVWIRIITHRLVGNWAHATVVSDTVNWLDEHSIPYRDLCFLGAKPQVEADAYVEDAPHNVEALRDSGNSVIVFDQPWNRELRGPRAHGWDEVETMVADMVAAHAGSFAEQLPGVDAGADRLVRRRADGDPRSHRRH